MTTESAGVVWAYGPEMLAAQGDDPEAATAVGPSAGPHHLTVCGRAASLTFDE